MTMNDEEQQVVLTPEQRAEKYTASYLRMIVKDCDSCKHYDRQVGNCIAFARIPTPIMRGKASHKTPYPGDHGIVWEPKDN